MKLFKPEVFQGKLNGRKYFEGWYFKTVANGSSFVIIPGISLGADQHSFIQLIDDAGAASGYHRYSIDDFGFNPDRFEINIGTNYFSDSRCSISIDSGNTAFAADLRFSGITRYPRHFYSPGIMGPFSFVPRMECYHGLVSADHEVNGKVTRNTEEETINAGRGYIEKDWGRSMPSSWIWLQSNSFDTPGISIMLSVARIPWLGKSFTGHLGFLFFDGKFHSFATYNGSRYVIDESPSGEISIRLENRKYRMELGIPNLRDGRELLAPVEGGMKRKIIESTGKDISVSFSDISGKTLFRGTGTHAGIEITGKIEELK